MSEQQDWDAVPGFRDFTEGYRAVDQGLAVDLLTRSEAFRVGYADAECLHDDGELVGMSENALMNHITEAFVSWLEEEGS